MRHYFEDAAHRVAGSVYVVDYFFHLLFRLGVHAAEQYLVALAQCDDFVPFRRALQTDGAESDHVTQNFDLKLAQERFSQAAESDARSSLPGARPLENIAGIGKIIFKGASQVRVSRTRPGHWFRFIGAEVFFVDRQDIGPILPILVL